MLTADDEPGPLNIGDYGDSIHLPYESGRHFVLGNRDEGLEHILCILHPVHFGPLRAHWKDGGRHENKGCQNPKPGHSRHTGEHHPARGSCQSGFPATDISIRGVA